MAIRPIKASDLPYYNGHGFYTTRKPVKDPNFKPENPNDPVQQKFLSVKEMLTASQFRLDTYNDNEIQAVVSEFRTKASEEAVKAAQTAEKSTDTPTTPPAAEPARDH